MLGLPACPWHCGGCLPFTSRWYTGTELEEGEVPAHWIEAHSRAHFMHTPMLVAAVQDLLASVPSKVDTLVFPNYEALPEADDVGTPFTQARCY